MQQGVQDKALQGKGRVTNWRSHPLWPDQAVAKLTADNLVFLMSLKKVEAELAAANQERAQLRLAAERQRGPWFDEVGACGSCPALVCPPSKLVAAEGVHPHPAAGRGCV